MIEILPMLADEGLEMKFPEATLCNLAEFEGWYQGVIRIFFDEVHQVKKCDVKLSFSLMRTMIIRNKVN